MPNIEIDFGYYPHPLHISHGPIEVVTRTDFSASVIAVEEHPNIDNGWLFWLPDQIRFSDGGRNRLFPMPKTHNFRHQKAESAEHITFHIWALSFFLGMRLTTAEMGFADATPVRPDRLVDFSLIGRIESAVALAETFWTTNPRSSSGPQRLAAAVHALFLAQNPRLFQFEEFWYLYSALDTCFRIAHDTRRPKRTPPHAERVAWMCSEFGLATPPWAFRHGGVDAPIVKLRNETFHEARFNGEPLGFALFEIESGNNIMLELSALICRLLVALFGAPNAQYVHSPIDTRQRHALDL